MILEIYKTNLSLNVKEYNYANNFFKYLAE